MVVNINTDTNFHSNYMFLSSKINWKHLQVEGSYYIVNLTGLQGLLPRTQTVKESSNSYYGFTRSLSLVFQFVT